MQQCTFRAATRNDLGEVVRNQFGEVQYEPEKILKCRLEQTVEDILTPNGSILRSSSIYYTDDSQVIRTDDTLDGRVVLYVEVYTNSCGGTEGYRSHA